MTTTPRFPNESADYRTARDELLAAESELRAQVERVAALRRELPRGGALKHDYVFEELVDGQVRPIQLSELFTPEKSTTLIYSFMYGPAMKQACPMCTSLLDALNGSAPDIRQRINFVVVAKSPIGRVMEHAEARGWNHLRLLSSHGTRYNADYYGENAEGSQRPMANVFVRDEQGIHHFWGSELCFAPAPGEPRHVDLLWPLWNVLDLTPGGRGGEWHPQLSYE